MSSHVFSTIYHFVVFTYYCWLYGIYKLKFSKNLPNHKTFAGDLKFMTIWCCLLQTSYFCICCVTDLIMTSGSRSRVGLFFVGLRDWFLCSIAFPMAMLVGIMYWGIFAIDPELIYPMRIRDIYPMWLSHCMHTYIIFLVLVDMVVVKHKQPSRKTGILSLFAVGISYLLWLCYCGFVKNIWVYPFMRLLEGVHFVLFILFTALFLAILYFIGEKLNLTLGKNKPDPDLMYSKID